MQLRKLLPALMAVCVGMGAGTQNASADPDWKELDTLPPPQFDLSKLVPFEVSRASELAYGIDPGTLSIGKDGVVRYVVVARSNRGANNILFEGIRCTTGEVRTYARHEPARGWARADDSDWKPLRAGQRSLHALMLARQGACVGNAAPQSTWQILRALTAQSPDKGR